MAKPDLRSGSRSIQSSAVPLVLEREVQLPVEVRVASSALATWAVPAERVVPLLDGTGLEPYGPIPGRALAAVGVVQYLDSDLGTYNEFVLALTATREGRMGTLIRQLPVNQAFTLEAGRSIWGFPKFMTESSISISPRGATIGRLADEDGDPILALRLARGWVPVPARTTELDTWSFSDGVLRRTPFTLRTSGTRARPGGATLQISGSHPMADDLRSLDLGHAVSTIHVGRLSATFHAAVVEPT
jgi:hypothetical protein